LVVDILIAEQALIKLKEPLSLERIAIILIRGFDRI